MNGIIISPSPHLRSKETTNKIMLDVIIALLPATFAGVYYFGVNALINIIVAILTCILSEYLFQKALRKNVTINDYSAALTGLLIALNIPSSLPIWITVIGSIFAIIVCKQIFGGLGQNFINPALSARVFMLASWPAQMTNWTKPFSSDAVSMPTPLATLKTSNIFLNSNINSDFIANMPFNKIDLLLGNHSGTIGETSAILLLIGGLYLIYKKVIKINIPLAYISTVFIMSFIFSGFSFDIAIYNILSGGLILGAFFMATDYATSPVNVVPQIIFAIGCGFITTVIRYFGGYPEGVSYSILLMNVATPLLDKYLMPSKFGGIKVEK